MVRPGSCLLGLEPERQNSMKIKPVMSFKTRVVSNKSEVLIRGKQGDEKVSKVELEELAPNSTNTYRMAT